jgi:hypothetical protein
MYVNKKDISKKFTRSNALQSSIIFLFIAIIALLSIWLPILFS